MKPWLTVVMPLHDGERFLRATLASVAAERPEGVAILAYDSSADDASTRAILEEFSSSLDISYRHTPQLKPWQTKVNLGMTEAETAHVAILHQDDLWLAGHLAAVRSAIAQHPAAPLSVAPSTFIDESGRTCGNWRTPFAPGIVPGRRFVERLIVQNTVAVPAVVYLREAWLRCGGMDECLWYTPDWDIYLKLAALGHVHVRETATTAFRLHGSSLTISGSADIAAFRDQLETVLDRHAKAWGITPTSPLMARARASIALNCALAEASRGRLSTLGPVALDLARLGPRGIADFLSETQIVSRVSARIPLLFRSARLG